MSPRVSGSNTILPSMRSRDSGRRRARAMIGAARTRKIDLCVAQANRRSVLMPALLARPIYEPIARWFGVVVIFSHVDEHDPSGYRERVKTEGPQVV